MNEDWGHKLQEEFPFLKQSNIKNKRNMYCQWGFECSAGWYELLRDCCQQITDRYADAGVPIDFVPVQIKEKFGTLRFYYEYENTPCSIAAIDFLGDGSSVRFKPSDKNENDIIKKLREDISAIIMAAEERSEYTCEECGAEGELREDLGRIRTLCDPCYDTQKSRNR